MKVYYTCTTAQFNRYKDLYMRIRKFLVENNHVLTLDWLPEVYKKSEKSETKVRDIKKIYNECISAIQSAEAVIIEDTVSNFSTGHQITVALQRKRPTLVLWQKSKKRQFNDTFINGIKSNLLEVYDYEGNDYEDIIKAFLSKYEDAGEKSRFNLVLDQVERNYLDWAKFTKGESRTQIIRDALKRVMDEDDEYKKYLLDRE